MRKRMVRSSTCAVNSSPICQFFCEANFTPTIAEPGSSSCTHSPCTCHQGAVVLTPVRNVASASTFLVVAKPVRMAAPFGRVSGLSNQVPIRTRVSPSTSVRAVRYGVNPTMLFRQKIVFNFTRSFSFSRDRSLALTLPVICTGTPPTSRRKSPLVGDARIFAP